ncbi:hypothetical protein PTNB73_05318 [Pyrenophora teres f. teres]|nr:hypothetical protein PTNB85_04337 [Pyrenophora teres f. teres]KAE8864435.1 hypothetical protein PTNB29_04399 [Pyrenophora teres f. teres]KAE8867224.1 hypothetical protein PTNB73_05318 [Pyrenophora teres f. teres]
MSNHVQPHTIYNRDNTLSNHRPHTNSFVSNYTQNTTLAQSFDTTNMPAFLHQMDTRRLHSSDMKRLVRILRHVPAPTDEGFERKEASYRKYTKEDIHNLPSRLRSSRLSFSSTNLCSMHKGLNHNLINDIWQWLRHEFEGAIGKFLYPLIMSNRLTAKQEWNVRQLEPVLEMWKVDFNLEASAPPDHEPISRGSQWKYQRDGCPACMMARIGSDEKVLFALFANMVGRFNTKSLTSTGGWNKTRSKRLRFIRYWVKATRDGDSILFQAGELGLKMKQLRREWKDEQRALLQSLDGTTVQGTPQTAVYRSSIDSQRPMTVKDAGRSYPQAHSSTHVNRDGLHKSAHSSSHDGKLGPEPRSHKVEPLSSAEKLGFELPRMRERVSGGPYDQQDVHPLLRQEPGIVPLLKTKLTTADSTCSVDTIRPTSTRRPTPEPYATPEPRLPSPPSRTSTIRPARNTAISKHTDKPVYNLHSSRPAHNSSIKTTSTFTTIASYSGGPSAVAHLYDPLDNPLYDAKTKEDRVEYYRRQLRPWLYEDPVKKVVKAESTALPLPRQMSMHSEFGNTEFDGGRFDGVDEELKKDEIGEWEKEVGEEDDDDEDGSDDEAEGSGKKGV